MILGVVFSGRREHVLSSFVNKCPYPVRCLSYNSASAMENLGTVRSTSESFGIGLMLMRLTFWPPFFSSLPHAFPHHLGMLRQKQEIQSTEDI